MRKLLEGTGHCLAILVTLVVMLLAALPGGRAVALADGAGYLTVSGVATISPEAAYTSFTDLAATLTAVDGDDAMAAGSTMCTVEVHGQVALNPSDTMDGVTLGLVNPFDTAVFTIRGVTPDAAVVPTADGMVLSVTSGSLTVEGVAFGGPLTLASSSGITVGGCTAWGTLGLSSAGGITVTGSGIFNGAGVDQAAGLNLGLIGGESFAVIDGTSVSGFTYGVLAEGNLTRNSRSVQVIGSTFDLAEGEGSAAIDLEGGPWGPMSVDLRQNTVSGAAYLVMLGSTFTMVSDHSDEAQVESVADLTIESGCLAALFSPVGTGTNACASTVRQVGVPAAYAYESVLQAIDWTDLCLTTASISEPQVQAPADSVKAGVAYLVTYDANGAIAGQVPDARSVPDSTSVIMADGSDLVCPGYVFQGWNTAPDGSGTFYAVGQVVVPSSDLDLYAQWESVGTVGTMDVA